ncbi:MAG: adenylate/guanylate cyclase domain-containing protein [Pseudomonadota bacterium]
MRPANWSEVLKSDLDKLTQLSSFGPRPTEVRLKEGERRTVAILFLDIQGFTAMSEKLDPEDVQLIIDNCFKILTGEIEKHRGYVDKYEGDRLMALFGFREASELDSEQAVRAALGMRQKFSEINRILAQRNISIGIRIGINTGLVVTGRIGKGRDQDFTVMGDAVNLASRLESHAPAGEILVSEDVHRSAGDAFLYNSLGEIQVKGKSQSVAVFVVTGPNPERKERWERSPFTRRSAYVRREIEDRVLERVKRDLQKTGRGIQTVAFAAPAGVGKSRLVHEFLKRIAERQDPAPMVARAVAGAEQTQPYGVFSDLIRKIMGHPVGRKIVLESGRQGGGRAEKPVKFVLQFLSGQEDADAWVRTLEPQALQLEIHLAVRRVLERLAEAAKTQGLSPLYVHLDDLQWIDTASLECMEFLGANLSREAPVFFIWTYRPEFRPTETLVKNLGISEFEVSPLSEKSCAEILENVLGSVSLGPHEREILIRRSAGNPFFLEELIQALIDYGALKRDGPGWKLAGPLEEATLPDSVHRILLGRIDHLDLDSKEALMAASVAGDTFPFELLKGVGRSMGWTGEVVERRLLELADLGFIYQRREDGPFGKQFSFRHALIRDVVYSTLLNHNKKILHELTGRAFEGLLAGRAEEQANLLYRHFLVAGLAPEALRYGRLAVERAYRQNAPKEGLRMVRELRDLIRHGDLAAVEAGEADMRLLDAECKFHDFLGERNEQLRSIRELERLEKRYPKAKVKARVALHKAEYFIATGDFRKARQFAQRGLKEMGQKGRASKLRMDLLRTQGIACYSIGDFPEALKNYRRGLEIARELHDRNAEGGFYNATGLVQFNTDRLTEALENYAKAHAIMTEIGDRRGDANALGNRGLIYWSLGEYSRALGELNQSHTIFREIDFKKGEAITLGNIGVIHHKLGQHQEALNCYEKALVLRREIRDRAGEGYDVINIGAVYLNLGEMPRALEFLRAGEKLAREVGSNYLLAESLNCQAVVFRKLGERDANMLKQAKEAGSEALSLAVSHNLVPAQVKAKSNLARLHLVLGDRDRALALTREVMREVEERSGGMEGMEEDAYMNHYEILKKAGLAGEARAALGILVKLIESRAGKIKEEHFRKSFLESVRQNRYALKEWKTPGP